MRFKVKTDLTDIILILGFLISLTNPYVWLIVSALLIIPIIRKDTITVIKGLLLFVVRVAAINSEIAAPLGTLSVFRYVFILLYAIGIILDSPINVPNGTLRTLRYFLLGFFVYSLFIALLNGSYPLVSITKTIMFTVVFYAVIKGVLYTQETFDWRRYIYILLFIMMILSAAVIPVMSLRTKNGHAFQGILNHPNVFGIVAAVFITFTLLQEKKTIWLNTILIFAVMFMQYISESRTGLFSSMLIIAIWALFSYSKQLNGKVFILLLVFVIGLIAVVSIPTLSQYLEDAASQFIFKGDNTNVLYSKRRMFIEFELKFSYHPILGTGFMTVFEPGVTSYAMDFDQYVETVNVFLAVLGELGILGFIYWLIMYGYILIKGKKSWMYLFITPFIISSGEMVFFSANSVGLLLFFCFAIYLFPPKKEYNNSNYVIE